MWGLFKGRRKCETQKAHPDSTIEKLPVEIQQHIASFLTPDSAACLTLCSKSLKGVIGQRSWFALQTKDQKKARLSFLMVLQRDLPQWLPCYHCEKLHPFNLKPCSYSPRRFWEDHPCALADGFLSIPPLFGLRFQHAQMIMKLYRLRVRENLFLDSLSHERSYQDQHYHTSARIKDDNLLVKLEWRVLLLHGQDFRQIRWTCNLDVCPHWKFDSDDQNLSKRICCQISHGPGLSCPDCAVLVQCQYCTTEFIVAFLDSNWSPRGQAIYITAWKNLGSCETPFDIRWRTQVQSIHSSLPIGTCPVPFKPGSILRAYENSANLRMGVDEFSSKRPLDSDVEFSRLVADIAR